MYSKLIHANKLVRDKIPELIEKDDGHPVYIQLYGYPLKRALFAKIAEELQELTLADNDICILEELSDIYEVFLALCKYYGLNIDNVIKMADRKRDEKGAFDRHFFLKQYIKYEEDPQEQYIRCEEDPQEKYIKAKLKQAEDAFLKAAKEE